MHIDFFQLTNQERLGGTNMIEYDADKHADSKKFKFLMIFFVDDIPISQRQNKISVI